jgi:hypothetical protein
MRNYNKFSNAYDSLYIKNLIEFQIEYSKNNKDKYFIDFYPSFGINNDRKTEFLIYGQAVNGWSSGFTISNKIDESKICSSIFASNKYLLEKNHNPLDWVNALWSNRIYNENSNDENFKSFYNGTGTYRAFRSFFWNLNKKLLCQYYNLDKASWDWTKKLVWSNLYKIAPEDSNPNLMERQIQEKISIELVKKEIEELNPKYCIVLTNLNWWLPFQKGLKSQIIDTNKLSNEIVSVEKYKNTLIIVTHRPLFGNSQNYVDQILEIIR